MQSVLQIGAKLGGSGLPYTTLEVRRSIVAAPSASAIPQHYRRHLPKFVIAPAQHLVEPLTLAHIGIAGIREQFAFGTDKPVNMATSITLSNMSASFAKNSSHLGKQDPYLVQPAAPLPTSALAILCSILLSAEIGRDTATNAWHLSSPAMSCR